MNELLETAAAAHGGLDRWNQVTLISVNASITGALWALKSKADALKDVRFEDKEWEDAKAWEERARRRMPELGMTIVGPPKEEIDKARNLSKAAWDVWLKRTGAEGKRAMAERERELRDGERPAGDDARDPKDEPAA